MNNWHKRLAGGLLYTLLLALAFRTLIHTLGWVYTYQGVVSTEIVSILGILLLRQFFLLPAHSERM